MAKVVARLSAELTRMQHTVAASAVIEQAKGVLMITHRSSADEAGEELARRARAGRRSLPEEARLTLDRLSAALLDDPASRHASLRDGAEEFSSARYLNGRASSAPPSPSGDVEPLQRRTKRRVPAR